MRFDDDMKHILASLGFFAFISVAAACGGDQVCKDDHCVCGAGETCAHDCDNGGLECHIQCQPGSSCDVGCAPGEECHVECSQSTSCAVDCANGPDCNITCPSGDCTVTNCPVGSCDVTCGLAGLATRNGSTATCP
jgi:hypothetical protein